MSKLKILISGGFGYIGSTLVSTLLSDNIDVSIMDLNIPKYFENYFAETKIYKCDITKEINISLVDSYDVLVHMASANDIVSKDKNQALNINTLGTRNILDFCIKNNIARIIYFSTFQVYGTSEGLISENTPVKCLNDYAITHYFAEENIKMFQYNNKIDYIILRPTNVFGPPLVKQIDRWSLVPGNFCVEAFQKQTITLLSSGKQHRDFISINSVCDFTTFLCRNFEQNKNNILNVCSGKSITIIDAAHKVKQAYERIFKKTCEIKVMSDMPQTSIPLDVSVEKTTNSGFRFSNISSMDLEIEKIFNLLKF